jgi:hypothetical protein
MRALALTSMLGLSTSVGAAYTTADTYKGTPKIFIGNGLLARCESAHAIERGICLGYIAGVAEYVLLNLGFKKVCPPEGVLTGHSIDVVMSYLKAHPEDRHLYSITLVTHALDRAWPYNKVKQ